MPTSCEKHRRHTDGVWRLLLEEIELVMGHLDQIFSNLRLMDHVAAKHEQHGRPACVLVVGLAFLSRAGW